MATDSRPGAKTVRRFDVLERLDGPTLLPNGWLKADAAIARTGIQEYRRGDGTVRRELRLPEEVFHPDALASFSMVPVTCGHPAEGLLTAENTRQYQRGHLGETVRRDGDRVRATVLVTDGELVKAVLAGKQQLSCGYVCGLDETPGEWNGQRYDMIQRVPRGNHVAVVDVARGGPELRLKLDAADAVALPLDADSDRAIRRDESEPKRSGQDPAPRQEKPMVTVKIDGVPVEVANDQAATLIEKAFASRDQALASAKTDAKTALDAAIAKADAADKAREGEKSATEKERARADAADKALADEKKARKDAEDPSKLRSAIKARVALETKAAPHLGKDFKVDEASELELKKAVLATLAPELDLKGKTDSYIEHRFDFEMERAPEAKERETVDADDDKGGRETRVDAEASRKKMLAHNEKAWQPAKAN
jgi:hypothetical protein